MKIFLRTKTRKNWKFLNLWKNWTLFIKFSNTLPKYDIQVTLRISIPGKPQKTYFSQTIAPSEVHCFLLKNYLPRCNFLEIFHLNDQFRPMDIGLYSLICHWNEVFLNFPSFSSFRIGSWAQNKDPEMPELFLIFWIVWIDFGNFDQLKFFRRFRGLPKGC